MSMFRKAEDTSRVIPGIQSYRVDAFGNVSSFRGPSVRRLRPGLGGNGYLTVALFQKSYCIHKLMQMAFFPGSTALVMNHKDGNKLNNHLTNLEAITPGQNNAHAVRTGLRRATGLKGERVGTSILTNEEVREIKARQANGELDTSIAADYPVGRSTIAGIRLGKSWKSI